MNMDDPHKPGLPELHQAVLDAATVERLLDDIRQCAEVVEVLAKHDARARAAEAPLTLDDARTLLLDGGARGVQLRYLYDGGLWWDTLLRVSGGYRLTRIRHEPSG
jgi:hypothetical protein